MKNEYVLCHYNQHWLKSIINNFDETSRESGKTKKKLENDMIGVSLPNTYMTPCQVNAKHRKRITIRQVNAKSHDEIF